MNRSTLLAHRQRGFPNVRATAGSQPNRAVLDSLENTVNDPQHVDAASRERVLAPPAGRVSHLGELADLLERALKWHAFCLVPDIVSKQIKLRGAHHLVREVWLSLCEASAEAGPRSDKEAVFKRFVAEVRHGAYGAPEVLPARGA